MPKSGKRMSGAAVTATADPMAVPYIRSANTDIEIYSAEVRNARNRASRSREDIAYRVNMDRANYYEEKLNAAKALKQELQEQYLVKGLKPADVKAQLPSVGAPTVSRSGDPYTFKVKYSLPFYGAYEKRNKIDAAFRELGADSKLRVIETDTAKRGYSETYIVTVSIVK